MLFSPIWESSSSQLDLLIASPDLDACHRVWTSPRGLLWDREGGMRYVRAAQILDARRLWVGRLALYVSGITDELPGGMIVEWDAAESLADVNLRLNIVPSHGDSRSHRQS